MQDVTELTIYQNALKLLKPIYKLANLFPNNEFDLRSQLLRSAKSIAPNIAEGFAKKRSQNEFKRFLLIALGSSDEVITHLRTVKMIGFSNVKDETCDILIKYYRIESKQINRFIAIIISNNPKSEIRNPTSETVEEHSMGVEAVFVRSGGAHGSENVGMSSKKAGENPAHRKFKGSWAT